MDEARATTSTAMGELSRGTAIVGVAAITLLALGIRFTDLGRAPFWRDEAVRAFYAEMEPGRLFRVLQQDVNAPLFQLLLHYWAKVFGTGELALRSLGAILGGLTPLALYAALAWPLGRSVGLAAALLLAMNPGLVLYSQELSVYSMLVLLVVVAIGAFDRVARGGGWGAAIVLSASLAGMAYTHMWSVLCWTSLGIAAVTAAITSRMRAGRLPAWFWKYAAAQAVALVLFAPWLRVSIRQAASSTMDILPAHVSASAVLLESLSFWYGAQIIPALFAAACVAAFLIGGRFWFRPDTPLWRGRFAALALAASALLPLILSWAVDSWKPVYYPRYTLICVPGILSMAAIAATRIPLTAGRVGLVALLAFSPMVSGLRRGLTLPSAVFAHSPLKAIAARISGEAKPGDVIVVYPEIYATTFNWYYRGDLPEVCYPALGRVELLDWHSYRSRLSDADAPKRAVAYVREHLEPGGRVWVIYNPNYEGKMAQLDYGDSFKRFVYELDRALPGPRDTNNDFRSPGEFEISGGAILMRPHNGESREPVVLTICKPY